ncbi:DNA glycosylase AlkZ-like family protein [Victivallis vadensis]|uniref:DNA glycosylase AlkZ-like family protein n=1 Tax=Victivallis vadensis TaxID=172901 RepID=UPI00307E291C
MAQYSISRRDACRFLIDYHHLSDETELKMPADTVEYVRKVGCIQFDPLDVVGRNPELVLQARCRNYRKGDIGELLYRERRLFDVWDKNMAICAVEDWPCFSRFRNSHAQWLEEHADAVRIVSDYLKTHEYACSSDIELEGRMPCWHRQQRMSRGVLECMCHAGLAVVHHKRGARRYYSLAEHTIPRHLLERQVDHSDDAGYFLWQVRRRTGGVGLLWNRPGDAWLGIWGMKSVHRNEAFRKLAESGELLEVAVEGLKHPLYLPGPALPVLENVLRNAPAEAAECRMIAPLDNLLWDRKLIAELFGFSCKWEVYTPAAERKYGYYVLPVLLGDRFIGRIELRSADAVLQVEHFWPEPDAGRVSGWKPALRRGLKRFAAYLRCRAVSGLK